MVPENAGPSQDVDHGICPVGVEKMSVPPFPFQASPDVLRRHLDQYVDAIIRSLSSKSLTLPKGKNFIEYPVFEEAYEALKQATGGFRRLNPSDILDACRQKPMALIVLRTILGFSPAEWAAVTRERSGLPVEVGFVRKLERRIKSRPLRPISFSPETRQRVLELIKTACSLIEEGAPDLPDTIHRLDKVDTKEGRKSLDRVSVLGVPYPMLLYERFLGRPFASHRDAVSELIGQVLEIPIERLLIDHRISFRKTSRAESVPGFSQAPDFIIPDEHNPRVVIEAKYAEDEGTARDKITRILRLVNDAQGRCQVIACIEGRGFVRAKDLGALIIGTEGKVFTLKTLNYMIDYTLLKEFKSV